MPARRRARRHRRATSTPRRASGCSGRRRCCGRRCACRPGSARDSQSRPRSACLPSPCPRGRRSPCPRKPDGACRGEASSSPRRYAARERRSHTGGAVPRTASVSPSVASRVGLYAVILVSWNVAGRRTRLDEQADRVLELEPDIVCLQEVTPVTAESWLERLANAGLSGVLAPLPAAREGSRPLGVLTASRDPVELVPVADVPWAERVLAVRAGPLEVLNVHSPMSPKPELAKVRTHEAVFEHLRSGTGPRVVLGDLNTPRREHADGSVWTFARTRSRRLPPRPPDRLRGGGRERMHLPPRLAPRGRALRPLRAGGRVVRPDLAART